MGYTSISKRSQIITLRDQGKTQRQIASTVGLALSTVNHICKTRRNQGELQNKPKSGRPCKLTAQDNCLIVRKVITNGLGTAVQLAKDIQPDLSTSVSVKTIARSLKRLGLRADPKIKKEPL